MDLRWHADRLSDEAEDPKSVLQFCFPSLDERLLRSMMLRLVVPVGVRVDEIRHVLLIVT